MSPRRWRLLSAALLAVLFVVLAVIANRPETGGFDRAVEVRVHRWMVAHPPWPRIADVTGTVSEPFVIRAIALLAALALLVRHHRRRALWLLGTVAAASLAVVLLKLVFARPRPVWTDPITTVSGYAFPSSHAVHAAVAAGCVIALLGTLDVQRRPHLRRWIIAGRAGAVVIAAAIGVDRVALGVHYPTDVAAGWVIGAIIVLVTWDLLRQVTRRPT